MIRKKSAGMPSFSGAHLQLFTDEDLQKLHRSTLEILRHTGIAVCDERSLDIFEKGGAYVDRENQLVKIPPHMVEDAIRTAPASVFLAGHGCDDEEKYDIILEDGRVYTCPFGVAIMMEDLETGELRETSKQDVADVARIVDYLDEYDYLFDTCVCRDADPPVAAAINAFEAALNNSYKPTLASPDDWRTAEYLMEMGIAAAGSLEKLQERPFFMMGSCTISPLEIPGSTCATIITAAENNIPTMILTMAMQGGMAPITMAGTLVVANAEVLASLVLSQLVRPGAPFVYGSSTGTMDMKHNATAMVGCPELGVISAALVALARMYKVPTLMAGL